MVQRHAYGVCNRVLVAHPNQLEKNLAVLFRDAIERSVICVGRDEPVTRQGVITWRLRRSPARVGSVPSHDQSPFLDVMIQTVHTLTPAETVDWA